MNIKQLILLSLVLINAQHMTAAQRGAQKPTKRRESDPALKSSADKVKKSSASSLSSSSEKLEKVMIGGYGNPHGNLRYDENKEVTFHHMFYGV